MIIFQTSRILHSQFEQLVKFFMSRVTSTFILNIFIIYIF